MRRFLLLIGFLWIPAPAETLNVAVDSSLREVARDLAQLWADRHEDIQVELSIAPLGTLKTQLEQKTTWDVVVLPGRENAQALVEKKVLASDSLKFPARNRLVILGRLPLVLDEELEWTDLVEQEWRSFAAGAPETTGSGKAVQALLIKNKLWDEAKPQFKTFPNERAALSQAQKGKADAAFVYASDVRDVKLAGYKIFRVEENEEAPILYVAAVVNSSSQQPMAREFVDLLVSPSARPVWGQAGFDVGGPGIDIGLRKEISSP